MAKAFASQGDLTEKSITHVVLTHYMVLDDHTGVGQGSRIIKSASACGEQPA